MLFQIVAAAAAAVAADFAIVDWTMTATEKTIPIDCRENFERQYCFVCFVEDRLRKKIGGFFS